MSSPSDFTLFVGRLHPLLVHLPIGLLLLLALLEAIRSSPRFRNAAAATPFILALAVPLSIFTAVCGWLLSRTGSYGPKLLQLHLWTGLSTAAVCAVAAAFYALGKTRPYRASVFSTIVILIVASHFGGSLTHGSDYLVRYAPQPIRHLFGSIQTSPGKVSDVAQLKVLSDVIQPMLRDDCVSCHGPDKSESGLRLDSLGGLVKGGKSGPALVAGKALESGVVKRLHASLEAKEHMPPAGKPQPASDQIALLEWWIDVGAPKDQKIAELKPPARIMRLLQARYGKPAETVHQVLPKPLAELQPLIAKLSDDLNVPITVLSPNEPWLLCNAGVAGIAFSDGDLAKLAPVAANLRWLDLAGTKITDAGLAHLKPMANLTRLHLERTRITDAGLTRLAALHGLEYLNLYGTPITDAGLPSLQSLPKLKKVYLWQTKVTPRAAQAFAESLTDTDQIKSWQAEIEQIQVKIKNERALVDVGTPPSLRQSTNTIALNEKCPISGKPVDPAKTAVFQGKTIAFCCDDCKAQFEKDPKEVLAKLNLQTAEAGKPR